MKKFKENLKKYFQQAFKEIGDDECGLLFLRDRGSSVRVSSFLNNLKRGTDYVPYPIEEFIHVPIIGNNNDELFLLHFSVEEAENIEQIISTEVIQKDYEILPKLQPYVKAYMARFFSIPLEMRIVVSSEEKMKNIVPSVSLVTEMPQSFKERHAIQEKLSEFLNIRNELKSNLNHLESHRCNPFKLLDTKTRMKKKQRHQKWGHSYGDIINLEKEFKELIKEKNVVNISYPKIIRELFVNFYHDFRSQLVEYCLEKDMLFTSNNFERFICYLEFFISLFSGIQVKYYIDELEHLDLDMYASEKSLMNLAEIYHYQLQFRIMDVCQIIKYVETKAKPRDNEEIEANLNEVYDGYSITSPQLQKTDDGIMDKVYEMNKVQYENYDINKADYFPPYGTFSKSIAHRFKRFDSYDNFHACEICRKFERHEETYKPACPSSVFRGIDKTRLIYCCLHSTLNLRAIKFAFRSIDDPLKNVFKSILLLNNHEEIHIFAEFTDLVKAYLKPIETTDVKRINKTLKNVLGEEVGFYFQWLTHYIKWLIFPAILGLLIHLTETAIALRDENNTSYLYINLVFAVIVLIWARFYMDSWKSKENLYRYLWGMESYRIERSNEIKNVPVDKEIYVGVKMPIISSYEYFCKKLLSFVVIMFCLIVTLAANIIIFYFENSTLYEDEDSPLSSSKLRQVSRGYWLYIIPVAIFIVRETLSSAYSQIARWLTNQELHIQKDEFKKSVTLKILMFEFFNYYFNLYYIAFVKRYFEACVFNDCYMEVGSQLTGILTSATVVYATKLFFLATFKRNKIKKFESKLKEDNKKLKNISTKFIYYTRAEYEAEDTSGQIIPVIFNFGYIIQFGAGSPISFFFIFLLTIFVRLADGISMAKLLYVKLISESQGIGVFLRVLKIMAYIGLVTNICVIFYTSQKLVPLDPFSKVVYLVIIENVIFFFLKLIQFSDYPFWFKYKAKIEIGYLKKFGTSVENQNFDEEAYFKFIDKKRIESMESISEQSEN